MEAAIGGIIYASVKPIFKIYFIIGMGWWLARKNILSVATCRDLSKTVVTALLPCLIFHNIVSSLESSDIKFIGIIFFEGSILFAMGGLLGLATHFICKSPKRWFGGLISVCMFPNISDLPIAYLQTLSYYGNLFTVEQGDRGVAYICIFFACQVFYMYSLGLSRLVLYDFRDQLSDSEKSADTSDDVKAEKMADDRNSKDEEQKYPHDEYSPSLLVEDNISRATENLIPEEFGSQISNNSGSRIMRSTSNADRSIRSDSRLVISGHHSPALGRTSSRALDLRRQEHQDIHDLFNEYSNFETLHSRELEAPPLLNYDRAVEPREATPGETQTTFSIKATRYIKTMLKSFCSPNSLSMIISLIIAMSPPLKALFVQTSFKMPNAPDGLPPLSFVIDTTSYVGAASVPTGLLLFGATIARLKVKKVVPGFWKTVLMVTAVRLIILPIFGVGFTTGLANAGWYDGKDLIRFVSVLEFGLPNATALIYFTTFHTDPLSEDHVQIDCLTLCLIAQYCVLFISLPFLVTFTLKVLLHK
ncbi:auxin efflux carrier [Metschnikowia bicuspidata]|uniref:Auxin efflux carrier n=1 Tax=Metschnikowia bicuspidata TaxID=27322 RepID=A0A4P9ZIR9_9ASCO|nr:auxin efflux carrier [Metschnikowia bicuspidata]